MMHSRFRRLFRFTSRTPGDVRREIQDEFGHHLDLRIAELMRGGVPEADARAQAHREFGDMARSAEVCLAHDSTIERQRWYARLASDIRQDLAYGCRLIARSPGFSSIAVLIAYVPHISG